MIIVKCQYCGAPLEGLLETENHLRAHEFCTHPVCVAKREGKDIFGPPHFASPNCESGKHNHCSCDICF